MFGYVKAYKPELKIKHYEEYRGVYCSLCRTLGKRYGLAARLTLNYDFTFLAIMRMSVRETAPCFTQKRCPFNPAKRCNFCRDENEDLNFAADTAMIMIYYKILDDIKDEKFFKRLLMRFLKLFFRRKYKKAKARLPEAEAITAEMAEKQRITEESRTPSLDESAEPSAEAMGRILALGFEGSTARIMRRIGYCIGKWVYITDAYADREKDKKTDSYNPLNIQTRSDEEVEGVLNMTNADMLAAYNLLTVRQFGAVTENVLTDGLYHSYRKEKEKNEKPL